MTALTPLQEWWNAIELEAAALPDLPPRRRAIDDLAKKNGWRAQPSFARRRAYQGGGWEYHWRLLPVRAQRELLKRADAPAEVGQRRQDCSEVWTWFDGLPENVKDKAKRSLRIVQEVEALAPVTTKFVAVNMIAKQHHVSDRTIWNWYSRIEGIDPADWLPYLAPRHRGSQPRRERAECSPEFLDWLKADYLRLGEPSFSSCYDRVTDLCKSRGLSFLAPRTARRWMEQNVPRVTQVFARQGLSGLQKCFPPQIRDRSTLTALEGVNADCHKIDVFVQWPGIEKPVRPQIVAFQDLFSNKVLAWRVDLDPNKVAVMSALGELIETWGIPRHCLFDNGREFANKWLTGGAPTRFRFKVREDDALGVLPLLGIQVHWATPAHGQAKPIERGFRDFADRIALDPRFAGAYVGNRPDAKPEDYGSRAIPRDEFLQVLAEGIAAHNARQGRLTDAAQGRSFDDTFAASYATAPIRKATAEQHRLWLMGQEKRKLHRTHGGLTLFKNGYWAEWMNEYAGDDVVARFDPENLHAGLHIYTLEGEYLGLAECREKVGFFDMVGARLHAKVQRARRKAEKQLLDAARPISVHELAGELNAMPQPESPLVEAKVVEMGSMRARKHLFEREVPQPAIDPTLDAARESIVLDFKRAEEAEPEVSETPADRFHRAMDIEARSDAGQTLGRAEVEWLQNYQNTPEFTRQKIMFEDFGEAGLG